MNKFGMPKSGVEVMREKMFGGMSLENGPELPELEMPEFGNVAEEPVRIMGGTKKMVDTAKGLVGGKEAEAKWRINGLRSLVLMDRDGYFKENVAKHPELNYLTPDRVRADKKGFNMLLGGELSRVIGDGDTYGVLNAAIESMPEEAKLSAKGRMQQCETEYQAHELLGELWSGLMQRDFDEAKAKHEAEAEKNKERASAALAAVNAELSETWVKKVMSGIGYSPVSGLRSAEALASGAMTQRQLDELEKTSLRAARAFDELMKQMHDGRTYVGQRLHVSHVAKEKKKEIDGSWTFGKGGVVTDEEIWQQTAHDESSDYKLDRAKIAGLVELMKREDGSIDATAFALFAAACHEAAYGEQAILSSDFWGNFTSALSDWGSESLDFADRVATSAAAETGLMPSGGLFPVPMPTGLHEAAKERQAILFTPDVEKVKGLLARVEDVRRSPAEGMSWVQATLTELGETAGDSAPFLVGSTINPMLGYAAFFPARTNEAIADNYYEGVTNPVAMAYIEGGWDTLAEGLFAKAVGKLPGVSKGLDWVGLKTVSVPAIGKAVGRIQGNAALRVSTNIALESVGELVVENVVAETGTYVTVRGLRALGVNFDEPEWKPFESSWKQMQNSSQTGATVAYCASLGLLGVPANRRAARDFAKSRKFLLEVGLTEGGVAEVQAAHAEYQKSASAELVRKKYRLEKVRAEAGDKAVEEAENKAGRPLEGKAAEKIRTEAGEKAVAEEVEKILTEQQGALDKTMRRVYDRDVLREDPVALKKRMEKRGEKFLEDVEVKLYAESGVRDAVLAEEGVTVGEKSEKGLRKVRFEGEKEGEVKEVEWTDEQLNAYVAMQREGAMIKRMRYFQTRVAGTALAEAEVTEASVKHELINLRALPARALARMQRNGGKVDYAVMQDLAEDAAEKISGFVAGGMSGAEARAQMSELPGVALGTLVQSANAFVQRVEELAGTAEGRALGINKPEDAVTNVFRMNRANAPGQSVLLYNKGLASEREVVEDLLESDVVAALEGEHASTSWEALDGMLRRVEGDLMKHGGGRLFSSKEKASQMAIIEAFSKLGQSYFLLNHGKYQMSAEAHGTIEYVQKKMADAQHLVAMSHAWEAFAKSKEGKAFLKKEGASFEKLLSDAGASVAGHYAAAKFDAAAFAAVREAYEGSIVPSLEAAKPVLEQYEAEQKALDRPAAEADVLVVPADESVTGEELKLEPEAVVDDSTGDFVPPPGAEVLVDKDEGGPPPSEVVTPSDSGEARASGFAEATPRRAEAPALGRGLANGAYVLMDGGSVYGVAEVDSIGLSEDVPQFKKKDTAVGRVEADADGTTHELAGGWNANSAPIHVWRRVDGRLEVISGRHRLAHAKKNGVKHIAVRVYDEAAGYDAKWAKLHDVEQNILDNTCNAIDVAYYFRHNPMPLGEAEARGLMPKTKQGEQTAASRMGLHVAAHASDDTFAMLVNGGCTAEDAYMACLVAASAEGQQLALEARAGKKGKKNSWEYVTALVRGAEQLAPADGGGMLDLFGNDESFRESSEKMARYVAAVRAGLKARLNVLQSAGRLNKKESVSKELGVKVKAPKDALRLIERIAMLDAAYERLDYELGIPAKVEAWDGKSAVPTKLDELEAKGTGVSYSFVSAEMDAALNDAEAESFAHAFHEVERSSAVVSSMPGVYVADIKLAKGKMKLSYDELKKEPIAMHDGRMISFTGRGYKEVTSHAADRRVLASFAKMRELASKSLYLGAAPNTQRDIPTKRWINQFHYYLGKANYPEFKEWCALNGKEANETGDAYVLIVVAEGERGDVFYDLDVTSVEEVENNKGVSENLEATRIPNPGRQDSSTPKGRIHRFKEYVNHIDAINAEIAENNEPQETPVTFSMRTKEEPIKKGIGYKVFYQKDGKLYPPMVANPGGEDTPVGVWLDADEGVRAGESKTGRPQVKAGGKGTQGGSGTLAYRPGWHLGKIPYALQFNRKNPVTGERDLFPKDFVWAEVEYAADVDYQDEAMSYGVNKNGKFQHSLAGLPRIPEDGYYEYRTNPNPATDPWIITGAMKVKRVLTRAEVDELVRAAGREPQKVEDSKASFSVIGQKAATWDKYADRAFKGRDDGMLRAEIDASQAKLRCRLKPEAQGQAELIAGYRRLKPEVLYSGAEYERMSRAQRLWQVMQAMLGKDEKLVENEHFERLAGYLRRGMSQEEYLRDLGLGEDAGKQEIKAALEAARDAHKEAMWEQVAKERMSREVFEEALAMRMGTAEERERLVLSEDDWVGLGETLGDILDYPELYRAYPALKDVEMVYRQASGSFVRFKKSGELKGAKILLSVSRTEEMMRGSLLHEVQHLIQVYEDFGFGGTARNVGYIFASLGRAEELSGDSEKDYKRLAGEVEARAVNDRKDMTAAARLATPFNESLEYPGEALAYRISEYEAAMDAGRSVVTFSIQGIIADWNMEVDNFVQNPPVHKSSEWRQDVYVCPTPAVMRMVGAAPLDIVMSHHVLAKVLDKDTLLGNGKTIGKMYPKEPDMGKHKMTVDELRKLPIALTSPVCIAESNRKGSIEVITDMQENGVNVLVAVQLEVVQGSSQYIKVNRIASLYGKEKIEQLVKHPMLYVNTAKAHKWLVDGGLQLPTVPNLIAGSKKRVLTPTDLVKYKFANGLSFSLSGRGMIDAAPLGRMAGEAKMQRLLNYARKEANRWTRTFGKDTPNARAAEAMGTVSSILASIHKELPPRFRPRVEGHMRYVEVYARLLESGKVRSYGRLSKEQRAAVEDELLEVLQDAKAKADAEYELAKKEALDAAELTGEMAAMEAAEEMDVDDEVKRRGYLDRLAKRTADATRRRLLAEAEAKKQQLEADIEVLKRDFAAEKLAQIASRMLNDAADAVEAYLIDEELGAVDVLMERLAPRKLPNGKYDKGRMSADAYRKFVSYVELMNKSKDEVAEKMVELGLLIAAEEAKSTAERVEDSYVDADKLDRLNDEISAWSIYGGLRGKNLDAVRKGVEALSNFAIYEKNAWSSMLKLQRNRAKRQALVAAQGLGGADEFKVKEAEEQHGKMRQRLKNLGAGLQSIGQMFYGLGGVPEMRALVDESLDALSAGHVALASREKRAFEQLAEYMEAAMGLKTERQRNNWMAALKKKHKTSIRREGEMVRHRLKLTLDEAAVWLEMSKAERDAKRAEMEAAADKQKVLAENVPYEEDIPLIREELRRIQDEESSAKYVRTVREFRKEAPKEPMVLSKDEALNILLLCEQADYVDAAHENGYTDEVLAKLAEFVGNEVLGFGYAMREVLENNGLAEVYESREGVPFPKVNNYWPGHFDQSARVNEQANALDPTSGGGTRYGMLITRVKHKLKFNLMGASNVFMAALAQQNNYICMGELTAKWRRLLSHNDFAMAMKAHLGVAQFKQFKELIELLDGAGVQESITQQTLSGLLGQFQSAHAMAVLAGSPITLVKQLSAMMNAGAWEGISCSRVLARIVLDRFGGGAIKYGDMLQKDYFQARYRDKRYFTEMMQLGRDANWSVLSAWARGGMRWIEKMDVLTNCASMTALYNITYHDLKKRNEGAADAMTEEEMHAECDRVVRNTLELGAQPLRRTQKSAFAALSRNALVKATCYMGSEALNKLGMTLSLKRRTGGGAKGFLKAWKYLAGVSIAQQVIVMLLDMARNADPVDEDEWAEWLLLNLATGASGLGLLQSVPVLGEVVQERSGGYVKTGSLGQMIYDFEGLRRSGKKVVTMATDEKDDSWADWAWAGADLGRRLTFLTGAWGGINSSSKGASELAGLLQSLNAMANTVRPVVQAERNDEKRMKAFRKKVEKGLAKARKATREREKQEREAEAAEKKAEREKREKAKRREERLKRL